MEGMASPFFARTNGSAAPASSRAALPVLVLVAVLALAAPGCKKLHPTDTQPLDQAGMWFRSIEELRGLQITDAEVAELAKARQAGISDSTCVQLVRIARGRGQWFGSGDAVAALRRVEVSEPTILELARMNQFGLWVGEAQAMRLAGLSDKVLLAVARRRAAGQPAPSGASLAQLKNTEMSEADILSLIDSGATDEQARQVAASRARAASAAHFVRQPHGRRRR